MPITFDGKFLVNFGIEHATLQIELGDSTEICALASEQQV